VSRAHTLASLLAEMARDLLALLLMIMATVLEFSHCEWAMDSTQRKRYSGSISSLNDELVVWFNRKPPSVASTSTEAEHQAEADVVSVVSVHGCQHMCVASLER